MEDRRFQDLFCERFSCLPEHFEARAFRELLYGHAKIIALLLCAVRRGFFANDLKFIGHLGQATDLQEANATAADFQDSTRRSFWRSRLKIRVSGRKASELARQLFAEIQTPTGRGRREEERAPRRQ